MPIPRGTTFPKAISHQRQQPRLGGAPWTSSSLHSSTVKFRTVKARARLMRHRRWSSKEKTRSVSETFLGRSARNGSTNLMTLGHYFTQAAYFRGNCQPYPRYPDRLLVKAPFISPASLYLYIIVDYIPMISPTQPVR